MLLYVEDKNNIYWNKGEKFGSGIPLKHDL